MNTTNNETAAPKLTAIDGNLRNLRALPVGATLVSESGSFYVKGEDGWTIHERDACWDSGFAPRRLITENQVVRGYRVFVVPSAGFTPEQILAALEARND